MKTCVEVVQAHGYELNTEPNGWHKILCPRHHDVDPSLRIAPDGAYWKCMVCDKGGGPAHLEAWITGVSFAEALEAVATDEDGNPLMNYYLQQATANTPAPSIELVASWRLRNKSLTVEQVDDILFSNDAHQAMRQVLFGGYYHAC